VGLRPQGSLGVFGGEKAATFPAPAAARFRMEELGGLSPREYDALERLQEVHGPGGSPDMDPHSAALMQDLSVRGTQVPDPEELWARHGIWRGTDEKPRFEIPDTAARWTAKLPTNKFSDPADPLISFPGPGQTWKDPVLLGDVLHHPELFDAYPHLAQARIYSEEGPGIRGAAYNDGSIGLSGMMKKDEALSTLLHEVQHQVQNYEGFAKGGSPQMFHPPGFTQEYADATDAYHAVQDKLRAKGLNPVIIQDAMDKLEVGQPLHQYEDEHLSQAPVDLLQELEQARTRLEPLTQIRQQAFHQYQNLAGEVEARQIQHRLEVGNGTFPPAEAGSMGFPPRQQILNLGGRLRLPGWLEPVDHNPFAPQASLEPVEHNPFQLTEPTR